MRSTFRDAKDAITLKNCLIFGALVIASLLLVDLVGYVIWRRFPIPSLIVFVAVLTWRIGRIIGHAGLTKIFNAASVGLGVFGAIHWIAAIVDANYFPEMGYVSWSVHTVMWGWIAFHSWRAYHVLKEMPPDQRLHVTEGTDMIYAQMTYRHARIKEALHDYEEAKKLQFATT